MTQPTHATSVNWNSSGAVGAFVEPHRGITGALTRLDGAGFWGYSLWKFKPGEVWPDVGSPDEFLQSAGTSARMSIELRRIEDDGTAHQYAVGRPGTTHDGEPSEAVAWADNKGLYAYPGEVYTAEQAAVVYLAYYDSGDVPAGYVLRELDLDAE